MIFFRVDELFFWENQDPTLREETDFSLPVRSSYVEGLVSNEQ